MISGCIITYNEEKNIIEAIDNIKLAVDQIVVVDSYSQDKTVALAKSLGAQCFERKLNNDFGAQRNFAISQAIGDWILMLDADERCSPRMVAELQNYTKTKDYDGYAFAWRNYANGNLIETPTKTILFRRYGHYIHEIHEKVQGLKNIHIVEDPEVYIDHRKTTAVQEEHLARYKKIIEANLAKYRALGDEERIAYYEEHKMKQKKKEQLWLNKNLD